MSAFEKINRERDRVGARHGKILIAPDFFDLKRYLPVLRVSTPKRFGFGCQQSAAVSAVGCGFGNRRRRLLIGFCGPGCVR